jgi:hypothetical protein
MSNGISAHGFQIRFNGVAVDELKDVTPPALTRKAVDDTRHNDDDDEYKMGIRRAGPMHFDMNFLPATGQQFLDAWANFTLDRYVLIYPDGAIMSFFGYVIDINGKAPVDDGLVVTITVQPSGEINLLATIGEPSVLLETGDYLLLETGDHILLES